MSLTLFSEVGCNGNSKELKESEVNIAKAGVKFPVKSAIVNGNPWILFSEERFQVELLREISQFPPVKVPTSALESITMLYVCK